MMTTKLLGLMSAIALLSLTACGTAPSETVMDETAPMPDTEATPEATESVAAAPALPEGVSLSDDGQTLMMDEFSMVDAYCMGGDGKLAISYVGEAGGEGQLVSCSQTFEAFDAARENGFADANIVEPAIADMALQLQDGEYTQVQCLSNQTSLEPVAAAPSDGHMVLNCL